MPDRQGYSDLIGLFWTRLCEKIGLAKELWMPKRRLSAEQIVVLLRQIEVLMSQGKAAPVACREAGIWQQSYYRWRKECGGLKVDQAKRMKELEQENLRLKAAGR
jgi:hypothetical protein